MEVSELGNEEPVKLTGQGQYAREVTATDGGDPLWNRERAIKATFGRRATDGGEPPLEAQAAALIEAGYRWR